MNAKNRDAKNRDAKNFGGKQISVRGILLLTAAFALWLVPLPELRREPVAVTVFWILAIVGGVFGHLIHTYVFQWRGAGLLSLFLLSIAVFAILAALFGDFGAVKFVMLMPFELWSHQNWSDRIWKTTPVFACIVILAVAHPVRPCLVSAIITGSGIAMWYAFAIVLAASAG